jgi:hypothetical protein
MKTIRNIIIGLCISALAACGGHTPQSQQDTSKSDFEIKQGKPLSPNDWRFYDVGQQSVCIPVSWTPANQHQYLFYVDLGKISPGAYFIVAKRTQTDKFNAHIGLKGAYQALQKDTAGIMTGDNILKMDYQDKQVYSGDIKTSGAHMSYTNYITVFEKYNEVFEIALKIDDSKAAAYQDIYKNIVFNFYSRDKLIFNATDKIIKTEKVDLDGL